VEDAEQPFRRVIQAAGESRFGSESGNDDWEPESPMYARIPALLIPLLLAGCAFIPDGVRARTVRSWDPGSSPAECHLLNLEHALRSPRDPAPEVLDPTKIQLLIWNVLKGRRAGWEHDFARYAYEQDLLILQEVVLTDGLAATIAHAGMVWDLAIAFEWRTSTRSTSVSGLRSSGSRCANSRTSWSRTTGR
jgi:hypothetical protein